MNDWICGGSAAQSVAQSVQVSLAPKSRWKMDPCLSQHDVGAWGGSLSETRSSARSIGLLEAQLCRKRVLLCTWSGWHFGVQRGAIEARPCDRSFKYALTTSPSRCTRGRRLEALTSVAGWVGMCVFVSERMRLSLSLSVCPSPSCGPTKKRTQKRSGIGRTMRYLSLGFPLLPCETACPSTRLHEGRS